MVDLDESLVSLVSLARVEAVEEQLALFDRIGERDPDEMETALLERLDRIVLGAELLLGTGTGEHRLKH